MDTVILALDMVFAQAIFMYMYKTYIQISTTQLFLQIRILQYFGIHQNQRKREVLYVSKQQNRVMSKFCFPFLFSGTGGMGTMGSKSCVFYRAFDTVGCKIYERSFYPVRRSYVPPIHKVHE